MVEMTMRSRGKRAQRRVSITARYSVIRASSIPRACSMSTLNSGRVDAAFSQSTRASRSGRSS
eukprot:8265581-Lingulodinium_polyedra.AAC.1